MKKLVSILLTAALTVGCLVGCGSNAGTGAPSGTEVTAGSSEEADTGVSTEAATEGNANNTTADVSDPNAIPDEMTSEDGTYQIAFVTDVGQLKDGSFNEGTWNGVKLYAAANGLSYKYYQPANGSDATDIDRQDAMEAAAAAGAELVVCAGFLQGTALTAAATNYPDTKFLFVDGWTLGLENVTAVVFQEEQCGYFAGYAAVADGFTKLGFCGGGGGTNPACCRYLYGFIQGANAAAAEFDVEGVEIKYTWQYGDSYSASTELQTLANGWYESGTEIIFSCGGSIDSSIFAAASANDAYTIGVDVNQSGDSDTVVTSAMKELAQSVQNVATDVYAGNWDKLADVCQTLGAADGCTGLPTDSASWRFETFTVDQYQAIFDAVVNGDIAIDADYGDGEYKFATDYSNVTVIAVD